MIRFACTVQYNFINKTLLKTTLLAKVLYTKNKVKHIKASIKTTESVKTSGPQTGNNLPTWESKRERSAGAGRTDAVARDHEDI